VTRSVLTGVEPQRSRGAVPGEELCHSALPLHVLFDPALPKSYPVYEPRKSRQAGAMRGPCTFWPARLTLRIPETPHILKEPFSLHAGILEPCKPAACAAITADAPVDAAIGITVAVLHGDEIEFDTVDIATDRVGRGLKTALGVEKSDSGLTALQSHKMGRNAPESRATKVGGRAHPRARLRCSRRFGAPNNHGRTNRGLCFSRRGLAMPPGFDMLSGVKQKLERATVEGSCVATFTGGAPHPFALPQHAYNWAILYLTCPTLGVR
jgi:hypothetical protein